VSVVTSVKPKILISRDGEILKERIAPKTNFSVKSHKIPEIRQFFPQQQQTTVTQTKWRRRKKIVCKLQSDVA